MTFASYWIASIARDALVVPLVETQPRLAASFLVHLHLKQGRGRSVRYESPCMDDRQIRGWEQSTLRKKGRR